MPRQSFSNSRLDRASRFLVESAPDLAFADSLAQAGSQGLRDDLAVASFNATRQQQELENARAAARDSLEEQARRDEIEALKYLSSLSTDKPGAEVEPDLILAKHPGALRSQFVRDLYGRKMQAIEQTRAAAEKYAASTGGEPLPLDSKGNYDLMTGELRLYKSNQVNNALASKLITPEEADWWKALPETEFKPTWETAIATRNYETKTLSDARQYKKDLINQQQDAIKTNIDLMKANALKPEDVLTMDPKAVEDQKALYNEFKTQAVTGAKAVNAIQSKRIELPGTTKPEDVVVDQSKSIVETARKARAEQLKQGQSLTPTAKP